VITCDTFEARIRNIDSNSSKCNDIDIEALSSLCVGWTEAKEFVPCTLCPNQQPFPYPDKDIVGIDGIGFDYIEPRCGVIDTITQSWDKGAVFCKVARSTSSMCGCSSPVKNPCTISKPGKTMLNPFAKYFWKLGNITSFRDEFVVEACCDINQKWTSCKLA
jgi:hypothetical protein